MNGIRLRGYFGSDSVIKFAVCGCAVATANMRPTYLGETQSLPLCVILLAFESIVLLNFYSRKQRLSLNNSSATQIVLYITACTYALAREVIGQDLGGDYAFKAFLISMAFIGAILLMATVEKYRRLFYDTFAVVVIASCVSIAVTFSIVSAGISVDSLIVAHLPDPPGYTPGAGVFAFPFTHVFQAVAGWIGPSPRMGGIFREPGVVPPFACWAATYAYLRGWPLYVTIICLVSSLLSLSTIGPLAFYTACVLVMFRFNIKPLAAILIIFFVGEIAWPAIYSLDNVGLEAKMNSGTGSYDDRAYSFWAVLDTQDFIFGDGNRWSLVSSSAGINLVSQIRVMGLIYFLLVIGIYCMSMHNIRFWLGAGVPALIAVIFSQPIALDPAFLVIFFSSSALAPPAAEAFRP